MSPPPRPPRSQSEDTEPAGSPRPAGAAATPRSARPEQAIDPRPVNSSYRRAALPPPPPPLAPGPPSAIQDIPPPSVQRLPALTGFDPRQHRPQPPSAPPMGAGPGQWQWDMTEWVWVRQAPTPHQAWAAPTPHVQSPVSVAAPTAQMLLPQHARSPRPRRATQVPPGQITDWIPPPTQQMGRRPSTNKQLAMAHLRTGPSEYFNPGAAQQQGDTIASSDQNIDARRLFLQGQLGGQPHPNRDIVPSPLYSLMPLGGGSNDMGPPPRMQQQQHHQKQQQRAYLPALVQDPRRMGYTEFDRQLQILVPPSPYTPQNQPPRNPFAGYPRPPPSHILPSQREAPRSVIGSMGIALNPQATSFVPYQRPRDDERNIHPALRSARNEEILERRRRGQLRLESEDEQETERRKRRRE